MSSGFSCNSKANASELVENLGMNSDFIGRFESSTTIVYQVCITRRERVNEFIISYRHYYSLPEVEKYFFHIF